jgi:uroporphyrinogen-III synthase
MKVMVTRPAREALDWVHKLEEAGFAACGLPLIDIVGPPDAHRVAQAWQQLPSFNAIMFVSSNAVDYFFASNSALGLAHFAQSAIKIRAFVTGPGSLAALLRAGVDPSMIDVPNASQGQFDSEALWAVMGHRVVPGYRVLVVRGSTFRAKPADCDDSGVGRDWFAKQVIAAGGAVEFVVSYQRRCPELTPDVHARIQSAISGKAVWLFSSSEAIGNLVALAPQQHWRGHRAVCTHARIAQAARAAGFGVVCESRPILAAVVASIESLQ